MYKIFSSINNQVVLKEDIMFLLTILDEKVQYLIDDIYFRIYDQESGLKYKNYYDLEWFRHQRISTEAKIKIARILQNRYASFGIANPFLNLITEMDPDTIRKIDILENKDLFLKQKEGL